MAKVTAYGQQGRIFEPFVQVGRKKGGAGLGLALYRQIVQLHGGRMGVYSRPGALSSTWRYRFNLSANGEHVRG